MGPLYQRSTGLKTRTLYTEVLVSKISVRMKVRMRMMMMKRRRRSRRYGRRCGNQHRRCQFVGNLDYVRQLRHCADSLPFGGTKSLYSHMWEIGKGSNVIPFAFEAHAKDMLTMIEMLNRAQVTKEDDCLERAVSSDNKSLLILKHQAFNVIKLHEDLWLSRSQPK